MGHRDRPLEDQTGFGPNPFHIPAPRFGCIQRERWTQMLGIILIIVVIAMFLGAVPRWPHSRTWGYFPSSALAIVLIVLFILMFMHRI